KIECLIDTGATCSSIDPKLVPGVVASQSSVRTIGFSGKPMKMCLSEPIMVQIKGKTVVNQFLMAPQVPITLIGRDSLCKLDASIKTTP
ncbi:MAG: hypothetical protein ACRCVV_05430, partial [Shewanella sp.]